MRRFHFLFNFLVYILFLGACGRPPADSSALPPASSSHAEKPKTRATNRPENLEGGVIIVEYHKIARQEARWDRSIVRFRRDLERFYKLGFRPVSLSSYLENKMDLPPGASPLIFTFDDSHPSQFRFMPDGKLDPDCALGIWEAFAAKHPDFPIRATFFILPNTGPWGQPKLVDEKFRMLKNWGCEVGSHTLSHSRLDRLSEEKIAEELGGASTYIQKHGFDPFAIALPFGISPRDPVVLKKRYRAALLVGSGPAPSPASKILNPMRLPRIQGIDGDYGITYWLDRVEKGQVHPYVAP